MAVAQTDRFGTPVSGRIGYACVPRDMDDLTEGLAGFVVALRKVPIRNGPTPGPHNHHQGASLALFDADVRTAIDAAADLIDAPGAIALWEAAIRTLPASRPTWIHGDLTGSNIIVRDSRIAGVIDFGCCAVGDPAGSAGQSPAGATVVVVALPGSAAPASVA